MNCKIVLLNSQQSEWRIFNCTYEYKSLKLGDEQFKTNSTQISNILLLLKNTKPHRYLSNQRTKIAKFMCSSTTGACAYIKILHYKTKIS